MRARVGRYRPDEVLPPGRGKKPVSVSKVTPKKKISKVETILCVIPVFNEEKILPYKLEWSKKNKIPLYLMDNYSTDSTWKWIQENKSYLAGACRVDTKGAFDLRILQQKATEIIHIVQPDWVIWAGADLFYVTNKPYAEYIKQVSKQGYSAISATVINLNNTGEEQPNYPFDTYFYCTIGAPVTLTVRYHAKLELFGDKLTTPKMKVTTMPGALFNMSNIRPKEEREETLRRRELAWKRGMRKQQGKHYVKAAAQGWIWEKDPKRDIRNTEYAKYYYSLGEQLHE